MEDKTPVIMYFALLGLYLRDREVGKLNELPRASLELYLVEEFLAIVASKYNMSEEEIIELSKQKIRLGECAEYLYKYTMDLIKKSENTN